MSAVLALLFDEEDIRLAESESLLRKLAAVPSKFENESERAEDEQCMAECIAYFSDRRRLKPIRVRFHPDKSPGWNIAALLEISRSLNVEEPVACNLIAATLDLLFPSILIAEKPSNVGTKSLILGTTCFHVTASPSSAVVSKCAANIQSGLHPVLLVPREQAAKSRHLAEDKGIINDVTIIAIEDFVASNIIELSNGKQSEFINTLRSIIDAYNRRLEEVETDMSLRIEVK